MISHAGRRTKGAIAEREVVKKLTDGGVKSEKISRSGYDVHDLVIGDDLCEVKRREAVPVTVYNWLEEREDTKYLFMRRNRKGWLVVMSIDDFIELKRSQDTCPNSPND